MELKYAMVFVSDIEKAKMFYRDKLGFPLKSERQDIRSAFFDTGGVTLGVHVPSEKNRYKAQIGRSTGILFKVPNVEAAVSELKAREVTFTLTEGQAPERPDKAYFADQDGNEFGLIETEPY